LGRESYEYMYARPWSKVVDFYAMLVRTGAGAAGLAELFGRDEVGVDFTPTMPLIWIIIFMVGWMGKCPCRW
jgi:hypothetical protein